MRRKPASTGAFELPVVENEGDYDTSGMAGNIEYQDSAACNPMLSEEEEIEQNRRDELYL